MTRIVFTSAGAPFHARNFQKQVQAISDEAGWGWQTRFYEWDYSQKWGYEDITFEPGEVLWNVGNFGSFFEWAQGLRGENGMRIVAHWIGTDILQHQELAQKGEPPEIFEGVIHIADAPNLRREAEDLTGQEVGYVRSIPGESMEPAPYPEALTDILCYVPTGREDFFAWGMIKEVATDYRAITFHVLAREPAKDDPANVRCQKEVLGAERLALYRQCFALLRPVAHDGVSLTAVEMAQIGRHIFHSSSEVPFSIPAQSVGQIEYHLDALLSSKRPPEPEIQEFYVREYSIGKLREDLERLHPSLQQNL